MCISSRFQAPTFNESGNLNNFSDHVKKKLRRQLQKNAAIPLQGKNNEVVI
jgi:hypothetical protein